MLPQSEVPLRLVSALRLVTVGVMCPKVLLAQRREMPVRPVDQATVLLMPRKYQVQETLTWGIWMKSIQEFLCFSCNFSISLSYV